MTIPTTNLHCRNISCTHGLRSSMNKPCKNNCLSSKQTRSIACFYYKWANISSNNNINNLSLDRVRRTHHSSKLCTKAPAWSKCHPWRSSQFKWPSNSIRPRITMVLSIVWPRPQGCSQGQVIVNRSSLNRVPFPRMRLIGWMDRW